MFTGETNPTMEDSCYLPQIFITSPWEQPSKMDYELSPKIKLRRGLDVQNFVMAEALTKPSFIEHGSQWLGKSTILPKLLHIRGYSTSYLP